MNLINWIEAAISSKFSGRKPGNPDSDDPHHILHKSREMYADDKTFAKHLYSECCDEVPHVKKPTWHSLTDTQKKNVANRIHSKAQSRHRSRKKVEKAKAALK